MATKEELTTELAVIKAELDKANARIAELEGMAAGDALAEVEKYSDGLYVYSEGIGFIKVEGGDTPGLFVYDTQGEAQKTNYNEGLYHYTNEYGFLPNDAPPAVEGGDQVEMLRGDLLAMQIQRDAARNEVASLKNRLANAASLHGTIDSLKPAY